MDFSTRRPAARPRKAPAATWDRLPDPPPMPYDRFEIRNSYLYHPLYEYEPEIPEAAPDSWSFAPLDPYPLRGAVPFSPDPTARDMLLRLLNRNLPRGARFGGEPPRIAPPPPSPSDAVRLLRSLLDPVRF